MVETITNYHEQNFIGQKTDQSEIIHRKFQKLFEISHTIKNAEVKKKQKPGCYPIQHSMTDTASSTRDKERQNISMKKLKVP